MSGNPAFRRSNAPPKSKPVISMKTLTATGREIGVVVSTSLQGVYTHWMDGRTRPCHEKKKECPGCLARIASRWKGALELCNPQTKVCYFVELTQYGANNFLALLAGQEMRGLQVCVTREYASKRAPLQVEILGRCEVIRSLPLPHDVMETWHKIWGIVAD